ncbi:MAG: nuclear transport factor 2 family protein, partial [Cypionkella sp.]
DGNWELRSFDLEDVQMITPAPDVAVLAYTARQTVVMDGKSMEMRAADSSTWVRGAQGWECHGHSETMLDAPEK